MGIVLDTSVLIAAERGKIDLRQILAAAQDEIVVIAAVTASELLHGVERAKPVHVQGQRRLFVEAVIATFRVAEFGLAEARMHARLWAELSASGQLIGYHDMMIAATALRLGFSVATLNMREFRQVPNLLLFPL